MPFEERRPAGEGLRTFVRMSPVQGLRSVERCRLGASLHRMAQTSISGQRSDGAGQRHAISGPYLDETGH